MESHIKIHHENEKFKHIIDNIIKMLHETGNEKIYVSSKSSVISNDTFEESTEDMKVIDSNADTLSKNNKKIHFKLF